MAGVVVGSSTGSASACAVRWAAREAEHRGLPLSLVHAWRPAVSVSLVLSDHLLADVPVGTVCTAAGGRPVDVLLRQSPDLLVLGGHTGSPHASPVVSACVHAARCPVVVVPEGEDLEPRRVVVGVAGSSGLPALAWAAATARLHAADLVVVHVWQPHLVPHLDQPASVAVDDHGAALARARGWVHQVLGHTDVELHAPHGGPLDQLLGFSADADLLVVGRSASHPGVSRLWHADLAGDLAGLAPCPVAVVPAR
jgi:nucleotide-binding universal stress UspA family protein